VADRPDEPTLDDVMDVAEPMTPHRRDAKASPHPDDEELEAKVRTERDEVGLAGPDGGKDAGDEAASP